MVRIKKISVRKLHLNLKISKKYHKIKYLLRIKHFRGRDVHSPFMYGLVRKALMNRRGKHLVLNADVFNFLNGFDFSESSKQRICKVFTYLEFENYSNLKSYNNTNGLIVADDTSNHDNVMSEIYTIKQTNNFVLMALPNIYTDKNAKELWQKIILFSDCVTVDLYYEGLIFITQDLKAQNYKMKF